MAFLLTNSQSHVIPHTHPTSDINGLTELIQANAVVVSATAPENPTSGKLWYNTTKGVFNIYNGSSWILVGPEVTPITKAQYDALSNDDKNDGRFYLITDNDGTIIVDWANVENKPTIPTSLGELSGTSDDITEGSSHLFMTPAERTNLGNQSGVNTGDQSASDFDIKDLADTTNLRSTWSGKQDAISDLATIRSGASAGATAVQPNDNVSTLTNDAGYITNAVNDLTNYYTKTQTYTKAEVDQMISDFGGFEVVETLPTENIKTNVIYLKGPIGTGGDRYEEWIYSNSQWVLIGETSVDLSNYFNTFTDNSDRITEGSTNLFVTSSEKSTWNAKQDALVSGTNIKTVNGNSLLGSGDVDIPLGKNDIVRSTLPPQDTTVLWYDTVNFVLNYYNDNAWKPLGVVNGGSVEPDYNITGNLWYDINNNVLRVYRVGTGWKDLAYGTSASTAPATVSAGHIWYDTTNNILKVYNGTTWENVNTNTTYTAGNGIDIDANNEISIDTTVVATKTDLNSKQDAISDLATIRSGASAGATAIQPNDNVSELTNDAGYITSSALEDYSTTTEMNNAISTATSGLATESYVDTELSSKQDTLTAGANISIAQDGTISATDTTYTAGTGIDITNGVISNTQTSAEWGNITGTLSDQTDLQNALDDKQDTISDLATIRSNATAGKSASDTIATYGDVVTHDASEFATTAQGALADTALQPNDNVSELTNDSGFITNAVNDLANYYTKTQTYTKTEVDNLVASIGSFEVVVTLPSVDTADTKKIYLLGPIGTGADKYEEYIVTESTTTVWNPETNANEEVTTKSWTKIGETSIDLSNYVTSTELATTLEDYATTTDLAAKADDSGVVHLAGAETITGVKTFTANSGTMDGAPAVITPRIRINGQTGNNKFKSQLDLFKGNAKKGYLGYFEMDGLNRFEFASEETSIPFYLGLQPWKQNNLSIALTNQGIWRGGTSDTFSADKVFAVIGDLDKRIISSSTEPSSPTEGQLWYDTTNDVLKVYDGTNWIVTGKTYTAGDGINIDTSNNNEISVDLNDIVGDGLYVDGNSNLSLDKYNIIGDGLEIDSNNKLKVDPNDFVNTSNGLTVDNNGDIDISTSTIAMNLEGDGLNVNGSTNKLDVDPYDFVNTLHGLTIDNSGDIDVDISSIAMNLEGDGLSVNGSTNKLDVYPLEFVNTSNGLTVDNNGDINIDTSSLAINLAGDGLSVNGSTNKLDVYPMAFVETSNGLTIDNNENIDIDTATLATNLAGTGLYYDSVNNNIAIDATEVATQVDLASKQDKAESGSGVPATTPTYVGQVYIDTTNDNMYVATGTSSSSDWTAVDTNTTYTAGEGIDITDNEISVDTDVIQEKLTAGDGITIENVCTDISDMQGPAPDGFHVPLNTEWQAMYDIWTALGGGSSDGTNFGIALKLPLAGDRFRGSSSVSDQGAYGRYRSSTRTNASNAYSIHFDSSVISPQTASQRSNGLSVRCFKNSPIVPTPSWTKLYGMSIESGGIFWSSTDGLISLSSNGQTWVTIMDKNLGATTVWNSGDTLSEANCGKYYQRGNNYGFPRTGTVTTSSTQVDASAYGPGNYYSSSTFITRSSSPYRWDTTDNANLRGGVSQGSSQECALTISSTVNGFNPSNAGTEGQVLTKTSTGYNWAAAQGGVSVGTTAPSSPAAGALWYDTTSTVLALKVYNGTAWEMVGPEVVPITQAAYDALSTDEKNNGKFYLITNASGTISVDWANVNNKVALTSADIKTGSSTTAGIVSPRVLAGAVPVLSTQTGQTLSSVKIWVGSQTDYEALTTKYPNTLYFTTNVVSGS